MCSQWHVQLVLQRGVLLELGWHVVLFQEHACEKVLGDDGWIHRFRLNTDRLGGDIDQQQEMIYGILKIRTTRVERIAAENSSTRYDDLRSVYIQLTKRNLMFPEMICIYIWFKLQLLVIPL
ncbi:unnamed protein product [Ambrosiozyma monospora]|uniref:Unnamed protein product n=1 Tax=Ambrosiozyma monospora TaxID=43982 RepID=A0A9W7DGQ9_AMBMO|nr:unnamed protein product [Ambrosiozyma monospora]